MRRQSESDYFLVGDLDAGIVRVGIERRLDDQTCFRRGRGDQVDHGLMAYQGTATPVLCDEAKEAMLDLVPFAGARRKMADYQLETQLVRQLLQRHLPKTRAVAVTPPAVGGDQQLPGSGKSATAHLLPPSADAVDGELGGVVVDPHAHPALVVENIVDTVGNRFPQCLVQEVVNTNLLGFATGMPLASGVLEIAYQLLSFWRLPRSQADYDRGKIAPKC